MSELADGLAATANEPTADTPMTEDAALDAVFDAPEAPATSESSVPPEPVIEPAAATAQPQTPADPNGAKGEPPPERWDSILANARTKAREETLAEYRDRLQVLDDLQRPENMAQLFDEAAADPRFKEQLLSRAAALLSAQNKAAKANTEPEPDLQTADGALVYSADHFRKWHQWNQTQTEQKLTAQFKPLQDLQERYVQHEQQQREVAKVVQITEKRGGQWKDMPFFKEHQPAILTRQAEVYAQMQGQPGFDPMGSPWDALQQAYREVVSSQALPRLQSQQTSDLVAQAARKRAGSSADPSVSGSAHPRKPRTVDEALDQAFAGLA